MPEEQVEAFLEEFNLLDPRKFAPEETVLWKRLVLSTPLRGSN